MRKFLQTFCILLFWLGLWQLVSMLIAYHLSQDTLLMGHTLLLPSPIAVLQHLFSLVGTGAFWLSVGASLVRVCAGYVLGMALGCLLGLLTARHPLLQRLLQPLLYVVRATPVSSFIILVLLWLVTDLVPVFISMLMVLGIFWQNIYTGYLHTDITLVEMSQVYQLSYRQMLRHIYLPSLRPYFSSAAFTALGLAWKSGIAAEVLCHPAFAMGTALYDAKIYLETADLFAWTLVVICLSVAIEKCIRRLFPGGKEVA